MQDYLSPQTGPYMPKSDKGKQVFMWNFARQIARHPEEFGVSRETSELLMNLAAEFSAALDLATMPGTRTTPVIGGKNVARKRAVAAFRSVAMQIKADPSITAQQRADLRLHKDDPCLTRVDAPATPPFLRVENAKDGAHIISFTERPLQGGKARPKGVSHMLLFVSIGNSPSKDPADAKLIAACTRQPYTVRYPAGSGVEGQRAMYFGRWLTGRGEMGPWSPGVSMIIAAASGSPENAVTFELKKAA